MNGVRVIAGIVMLKALLKEAKQRKLIPEELILDLIFMKQTWFINNKLITACKQYCLAADATQANIACTQIVMGKLKHHRGSKKAVLHK